MAVPKAPTLRHRRRSALKVRDPPSGFWSLAGTFWIYDEPRVAAPRRPVAFGSGCTSCIPVLGSDEVCRRGFDDGDVLLRRSAAHSNPGYHLALPRERHAAAHRGVSAAGDGEEGIELRAWLHEGNEVGGGHPREGGRVAFRSARSSGNAGAPDMRWLRTTLPWMSMTVTATSTCCLRDPASTRSAMSLAVVSKSMVVCFLPESEARPFGFSARRRGPAVRGGIRVDFARLQLLEPLLQEGFDSFLCRWSVDGVHARVPAGSDLDVRRQAGVVYEALGVGDRPLVRSRGP